MDTNKETTPDLKINEVEIGQHFWATRKQEDEVEIFVCVKTVRGIFVCGDWEGCVPEDALQIIQVIPRPSQFESTKLLYN